MEAADDCQKSKVSLRWCYPMIMIPRYLHWKMQFFRAHTGPTWGHRQHFIGDAAGPFNVISKISLEIRQAHSMLSAASLRRSCGPMHDHREYFSGLTMGPHESICSIALEMQQAHSMLLAASLRRSCGPMCGYWEYFSALTIGPHEGISSMSLEIQQAHSMPSAAFHWRWGRPIQCYRQHLLGEVMGLFMTIGNILQQQ